MPYFRIPFSSRVAAVSAVATLGAALTLPVAHAARPAPLPTPTGDMALSPAGPDIVPPAASSSAGATPRASRRGSDTYTYLRCWYRIDADPLKPAATYEWARNAAGGDWYRVSGYWWADGITQWKNMFYSTTTQDTLADVCRKTLAAKGIKSDLVQAVAANNALSFNYTVWTIDAAQQDARVNKLIVFGDSLSDTQNMFNASQWKLPNGTSWQAGRFSNGPVWAEYLANALRLPFYNWAIGGAATDQYLVVPGLVQQIDSWREYMDRAPDYRPANTLFAVFAGGNDLVNYGRSPEQAANAVRDSLERLAAAGATRILLVTLPDVSRAPVFATRADTASVAAQVKDYNRRLADACRRAARPLRRDAAARGIRRVCAVRRPAEPPGPVRFRRREAFVPRHPEAVVTHLRERADAACGLPRSGALRILGHAAPHHAHACVARRADRAAGACAPAELTGAGGSAYSSGHAVTCVPRSTHSRS
ncbi:SGNH/GDSL hydrolase family protein [Burkholderia contaminans]|uniref:SGNH/GDSL hydrolase family protein n=1 Tax=Burkholderia contaminans TaxID=488447 RepID=UPI00279BB187|nr:SGNH/GDSL hydrolase family protein [Burkholderia contaminans]